MKGDRIQKQFWPELRELIEKSLINELDLNLEEQKTTTSIIRTKETQSRSMPDLMPERQQLGFGRINWNGKAYSRKRGSAKYTRVSSRRFPPQRWDFKYGFRNHGRRETDLIFGEAKPPLMMV
jgi:hypothetical protein